MSVVPKDERHVRDMLDLFRQELKGAEAEQAGTPNVVRRQITLTVPALAILVRALDAALGDA